MNKNVNPRIQSLSLAAAARVVAAGVFVTFGHASAHATQSSPAIDHAAGGSNTPSAKNEVRDGAKSAAVTAARIVVGNAIGGTVGAVVTGNPVTAGVMTVIKPSVIGCQTIACNPVPK